MKNKLLILISLIILLLSYVYYDVNKKIKLNEEKFEVLKEKGMENKKCKLIKSNYNFKDIKQLNEEFIIVSTINNELLFDYNINLRENIKQGKIFSFNLKKEELFEIPLLKFPKDQIFNPIGIDILNKNYLFVINQIINQNDNNEQIEIFKINLLNDKKIELIYEKNIILPKNFFGTINGISAIDLNSFYFITSNGFSFPQKNTFFEKIIFKIKNIIDIVLKNYNIKINYLYLYDKGKIIKFKESESLLNNGIVYDSKNKFLFVSRTFERDIQIYKIYDFEKEGFRFNSIKIPYNIMNIFFKNNKLYCGISSNIHYIEKIRKEIKEKGYSNDINHCSGFIEITLSVDNNITDVLIQNKFKAVNSVIKDGNKIILSSLIDKGLFVCHEL